jgi:tRNA A-37 threonylcarbamoyl transferase component Bud32/dipeptidyl aminopeptidase/acylaminoacyl peptidase
MKTFTTRLLDLLQRYEDEAAAGTPPDPAALCADAPELLPAFQEALRQLDGFRHRYASTTILSDAATLPHGGSTPGPLQVGGFVLGEELGRGGMGVVYAAEQTALRRRVALKMILAAQLAGPQALDRFRREAEAVARLRHPGIVQVFEVGTWTAPDGGQGPFMVLEFLEGGTLARKLAGQPISGTEAATLLRTLAEAMQHAHEQGVVHRDLKPGNVLLTGEGVPKIADFGLARLLDDAEDAGTRTGAVMGTPSYMAPEQAAGETKRVGPAADVWALGAILYECLTGRPPFRAATPTETLRLVRETEPVPPRSLNPTVPRDLETITLKCLRKEPHQRYASAQELADDLGRWLAGRPIHARPVGRLERAWKWVRRNPVVTLLTTATLLTLVAGLTASLVAWSHAEYERGQAEQAGQAKATALEETKTALKDRTQALADRTKALDEKAVALGQAQASEQQARVALFGSQLREAQRALRGGDYFAAQQALLACRWDLAGWDREHLWASLERRDAPFFVSYVRTVPRLVVAPGGQRIAIFQSYGKLAVVDDQGRERFQRLLPGWTEAFWTADGSLVLYEREPAPHVSWLNPDTGRSTREVALPVGTTAADLAPDGHTLSLWRSSPGGSIVSLFDVDTATERELARIDGRGGMVARFAPDGRHLLAGLQAIQPGRTAYTTLRLLDAATGEELWGIEGGAGPRALRLAGFTPGSEAVVQEGEGAAVCLRHALTGAVTGQLDLGGADDPDHVAQAIFLDPAGNFLGWVDRGGGMGVMPLKVSGVVRHYRSRLAAPEVTAAFQDGTHLLVAGNNLVRRLDLAAGPDALIEPGERPAQPPDTRATAGRYSFRGQVEGTSIRVVVSNRTQDRVVFTTEELRTRAVTTAITDGGCLVVTLPEEVRIWDIPRRTATRARLASGQARLITSVLSPAGDRLFVLAHGGSWNDRFVEILHLPTGESLLSLPLDRTADWGELEFDARRGRLIVRGDEPPPQRFIPPPGTPPFVPRHLARAWEAAPHHQRVVASRPADSGVSLDPTGRLLRVGDRWLDLTTGEPRATVAFLPLGRDQDLFLGARGNLALAAPPGPTLLLRLIDVDTGADVAVLTEQGTSWSSTVSPDSRSWAVVRSSLPPPRPVTHEVFLWDIPGNQVRWRLPLASHDGAMAFAPGGEQLAVVGTFSGPVGRQLRLLDTVTGEELQRCPVLTRAPNRMQFLADGQRLLFEFGSSEAPKIIHAATGSVVEGVLPPRTINAALSRDGHTLAVILGEPTVILGDLRVLDVATGGILFQMPRISRQQAQLTQDGRRVLFRGFDGDLQVWDVPRPAVGP